MANGINSNYANTGASMNDYRSYSRACVMAGYQPMDKSTWASYGAPTSPTGREEKR